jgi:hypothetical protein
MLETALHTGAGHPDLWLIAVPSFLAFLTGLVLGSRADSIHAWNSPGEQTDDTR